MTEARRSPAPRFSDEAVRSAMLHMTWALNRRLTPLRRRKYVAATRSVLCAPSVRIEFDAACLSAWRSGQETAGKDLAERLVRHALDAERLCPPEHDHDTRYCSRCSDLEDGLLLAADLIEQWTRTEVPDGA